jgi:hypothetical protein
MLVSPEWLALRLRLIIFVVAGECNGYSPVRKSAIFF